MAFNIDVAIVVIFLAINLIAGIYSGKGIKTIKEYAIGNRNFSTAALAATIIATWIAGSDFAVSVSETYVEGIWYLVAGAGDVFALLIIAYVFSPRMKEFFGNLSVAETMGNLYGQKIRVVTAISSIAQAVGQIAMQIKVFSTIFSHFLGFSSIYATVISSFIVIFYSAWGGIKSVTFTDVIQFFTFGMFIPMFALFIWHIFGDTTSATEALQHNPLFDYSELINPSNPKFYPYLFLLIYFSIPSLNCAMFQRVLMAKDTTQIKHSFSIAAFVAIVIHIVACLIGLIILCNNSKLDSNNIVMHVIDNYSFAGLKGITIIGIIAMIMSTADSWINTASVIFSHDFCKPLGLKFKNELLISRLFALIIGTGAVLMALSATNLLKLQIFSANFYRPIITVPLILAILGFRSTPKAIGIAMVSGALSVIIWRNFIQPLNGIDSVIPSMFINLITFVGAHYLLKQPGGWVGIKDDLDLKETRRQRRKKILAVKNFLSSLSLRNVLNYCQTHAPKNEAFYLYFSFGALLTIVTAFSLDKETYKLHSFTVNILQGISLFISTVFICQNLLFSKEFKEKYMGLMWHLAIFISLSYVSSFFVLISKFSQISLVIFILNLTIIGMLLTWQITLAMIIFGALLAFYSYKLLYIGLPITSELNDLKLQIIYTIFLISGFLLAFIKPKQELQELTEQQASHLGERMETQQEELQSSLQLRNEFLRNLEHEAHTPITGITSMGQVLYENYHKLSDKQKYSGLEEIAKSSERLSSLVNNLIDLSKLSSLSYKLDKKPVNLSEIVHDRLEHCKKLYLGKKELEFSAQVEDDVVINCDGYYIKATLDNLIINAIQYSKEGNISIKLSSEDDYIKFSIDDEGIGIPKHELHDIFLSFTVSSKTKTPAGGRGVGLALCEKAITAHNGKIRAESDGVKGAKFIFILPSKA